MYEIEHTLLSTLARHEMSLSDLAKETGYDQSLFDVVSGKSRQVPTDFFIRIADALGLSNREKDELVGSWAFGVWRWH